MIMKLGKHNIEGITVKIMKKQNEKALAIPRVFNLHYNCKNLNILYLNTVKYINWELFQD